MFLSLLCRGVGWRKAGLLAGCAEAEHVEAVAVGLEAFGVGELADGLGDLLFEAGGEGHVGDLAAVDA